MMMRDCVFWDKKTIKGVLVRDFVRRYEYLGTAGFLVQGCSDWGSRYGGDFVRLIGWIDKATNCKGNRCIGQG